jgi:hypothetical protein
MPVDHKIVYHLQDAFNLLPDLGDRTVRESFAASTNDALLVVYLSSLLRAVIALHALVDNKATVGRAELEEGGGDEKGKDKEKTKEKEKEKEEKEEKEKEKEKDKKDAEKDT